MNSTFVSRLYRRDLLKGWPGLRTPDFETQLFVVQPRRFAFAQTATTPRSRTMAASGSFTIRR